MTFNHVIHLHARYKSDDSPGCEKTLYVRHQRVRVSVRVGVCGCVCVCVHEYVDSDMFECEQDCLGVSVSPPFSWD